MMITPTPTDEEAAAITAAVMAAWPRPAATPANVDNPDPRWRFSGRWWAGSVASSRQRPRRY